MKIDVSNLTHETGREKPVSWEVAASDFESVNPNTQYDGRLKLDGYLRHIEQGIIQLDAELTLSYRSICDRCLTDIADTVCIHVNEQFVPERNRAQQGHTPIRHEYARSNKASEWADREADEFAGDADEPDDDSFTYPGHTIDLREAVGQLLILDEPSQMICREDCQGLCPLCGQDLNEGSCSCQSDVDGDDDSPFADLKKLL